MPKLACSVCDNEYDSGPDEPWKCVNDHPLEFRGFELPEHIRADGAVGSGRVWDFADMYPMSCQTTLGEGNTPEIPSDQWNVAFKLDYLAPSASFKDRGTTTMISRAVELGVTKIVDDSSGNAGSSVAQYAARAGISVEIFVPANIPRPKRAAIESTGAEVVPIEGSREDVRDACVREANSGDSWYASHAWRPSFLAGMKSFAFEIAARRDWSAPDSVVLPVGAGTLFVGAFRGFEDLVELGMIESMPRLLGGQASGYAPIVERIHGQTSTQKNELAEGLHTANPPRKSQILDAIEVTGGDVVAISESQTKRVLEKLRRIGFYIEPTAAVAPAAFETFRERGTIGGEDDVVVALTGSGLNAP